MSIVNVSVIVSRRLIPRLVEPQTIGAAVTAVEMVIDAIQLTETAASGHGPLCVRRRSPNAVSVSA